MSGLRDLLEEAFEAFNARDPAPLHRFIHPDATWPNTLETGEDLVGRDAVLAHFARVLATLHPNIQLISVIEETADALTVEAQYAVESDQGQLWSDTRARLTYHFRDGLLSGMTILSGF
jgi:nuclear transport factor 2 (NTF2) superfamily protein